VDIGLSPEPGEQLSADIAGRGGNQDARRLLHVDPVLLVDVPAQRCAHGRCVAGVIDAM
jgi:hypothetical protein